MLQLDALKASENCPLLIAQVRARRVRKKACAKQGKHALSLEASVDYSAKEILHKIIGPFVGHVAAQALRDSFGVTSSMQDTPGRVHGEFRHTSQ